MAVCAKSPDGPVRARSLLSISSASLEGWGGGMGGEWWSFVVGGRGDTLNLSNARKGRTAQVAKNGQEGYSRGRQSSPAGVCGEGSATSLGIHCPRQVPMISAFLAPCVHLLTQPGIPWHLIPARSCCCPEGRAEGFMHFPDKTLDLWDLPCTTLN